MLLQEGKRELLFLTLFYIHTHNAYWSTILLLLLLYFFRSPRADFRSNDNQILSPSYGTIQNISNNNNQICISIILKLNDVHTQYIPYTGNITSLKHINGTFNPLYLTSFEKTKNNERFYTQIKTKFGYISIIQFAGMIARRIVNNLSTKTIAEKGDIFGMIKFSSRVDLIVPKHCSINVNVHLNVS